ncbi:hypothetical protein [Paenibacillus cremeus]|uniref:DUF3784 domain-containing protein n=1 Tax=Paenibacillus cremeus TaxID=2163881 RepID=A0A559KCI9_9BACL|nr:hypothetical protein [Paenibacillus cremeus]TVY09844.1 hypothetical protein FPZ49_10750 [Paenibacillus cremeus]
MIFWTLVFITTSLLTLFNKGIFQSLNQKMKQLELKRLGDGNDEAYTKEFVKFGCFSLIAGMALFVAQIVYIIKAIEIDPYKYPSILAVAIVIICFLRMKKSKKTSEMNEQELIIYKAELLKPKKRTFLQVVLSLLWAAYFGYMFYVLVF